MSDANVIPDELAKGTPRAKVLPSVEQARLAAQLLEPTLKELRADVREIRGHSRAELFIILSIFGAGFVLLASLFIWGYMRLEDRIAERFTRLDDKVNGINVNQVRIETRLTDLLERMPPAVAPLPPRRQ